jgi:hypothetical protein
MNPSALERTLIKGLYITVYEYRDDLDEDDLRELTRKFIEIGIVISHYTRLDGRGGFVIQETPDDPEQDSKSRCSTHRGCGPRSFPRRQSRTRSRSSSGCTADFLDSA